MDKSELEFRQRKGDEARRLTESEVFKEAVRRMRDRALDQFRKARPEQHDLLTIARLRYELTEEFITEFGRIMGDGIKAASDLKAQE